MSPPSKYLGYDPTLSFSTTISQLNHLHTKPYISVNRKKHIIECMIFCYEMIYRWATLCFVIKDCWAIADGWQLRRICWQNSRRVGYCLGPLFLRQHVSSDIRGEWFNTSTLTNLSIQTRFCPPWELNSSSPTSHVCQWTIDTLLVHTRAPYLVFSLILLTVHTWLRWQLDCTETISVHKQLVAVGCILHWDISLNNIPMYLFRGTWPVQQNKGDDAQLTEREKIIQQCGFHWSILITLTRPNLPMEQRQVHLLVNEQYIAMSVFCTMSCWSHLQGTILFMVINTLN